MRRCVHLFVLRFYSTCYFLQSLAFDRVEVRSFAQH